MLRGRLSIDPDYVIDLTTCSSEAQAERAGSAYEYLKKNVYPLVREKARTATTDHYKNWLRTWWRPFWPRLEFIEELTGLDRIIACSRHAARPVFVFLSRAFFPTESLQLFALDDDYSFGIIQSRAHWLWAVGVGSKIKDDTRYTGDVWETFPWPQQPDASHVAEVASAARALRASRAELMDRNRWSLRELHQAADVPGPHPLNDAQAALDRAVAAAYGIPSDQEVGAFLLEMNRCLAEDEEHGRSVTGPGLPPGLDSEDARWSSDDRIDAPPLSE